MAEFKLAGRWKEFLDNSSASQSFYDSKMKRQDEKIRAGNQQLINQGYPVKLDDPLSTILDESTGQMIPVFRPKFTKQEVNTPLSLGAVANLKSLLGVNTPTPVRNSFLRDKTAEEYSEDERGFQYAAPLNFMGRAAKRLVTLGKQQVDNVPGLNAIATGQEDQLPNITGALIQAGGRVLPLAGIALQTLNAGPTGAATLDEARRKGWMK
jgi:hypothetical protein